MNMNQNEQVLSLMEKAKQSQESGDFNAAYETYREAAQMGSDEAMMAIARLFLHTSFRQENRNDWAKPHADQRAGNAVDMHSDRANLKARSTGRRRRRGRQSRGLCLPATA